MKYHRKLLITFILILFISCVLGSLLKKPVDFLVQKSDGFAHMVDYKDGVYNYGKVMRRIFMIVTISLLILSRKSLDLTGLIKNGLRFKQNWIKNLITGLIIGVGSLFIYSIFTYLIGVQFKESDTRSFSELMTKPLTYLFAACLTSLFEETLFRSFVFRGLRKELTLTYSVVFSSFFYAILHFFSFKVIVPIGALPFAGFSTFISFFACGFADFVPVLQFVTGLFIVGAILALVYEETQSLYLSIGLHAGWVFGIKINSFLLDRNKEMANWFFGNGPIVSGVCGWIFLVSVFLFIKMVLFRNSVYGKNIN